MPRKWPIYTLCSRLRLALALLLLVPGQMTMSDPRPSVARSITAALNPDDA
jgi:hypothetical protein